VTGVSERNKRKVELFVDAVWNEGRLELIDELVAADYLGHVYGLANQVSGPQGVRRLVSSRRLAYPGLYVKIEDQIAEHDLVVTRWRATADPPEPDALTAGVEPARCCAGISIVRLLAGKQVDSHTGCTSAAA
jgi:hypothetical protein